MHQPATPAREPIAKHRDQIDITGRLRNARVQNICRLVDHGQNKPLANFLPRVIRAGYFGKMRLLYGQIRHNWILNLATAPGVAIPARACLAAQFPQLNHSVGNGDIAPVWITRRCLTLPIGMGDIQSRKILSFIGPHGVAKLYHGLINLPRG